MTPADSGTLSVQLKETSGFSLPAPLLKCNASTLSPFFSWKLWKRSSGRAQHPGAALPVLHVSTTDTKRNPVSVVSISPPFTGTHSHPCQDPGVHLEPAEPPEERSSELSHAPGSGLWPHPAGAGRDSLGGARPTPVWNHSDRQAMPGGSGPRQRSNRGPNEPAASVKKKTGEKWLGLWPPPRWRGRRRWSPTQWDYKSKGLDGWRTDFSPALRLILVELRLECFSEGKRLASRLSNSNWMNPSSQELHTRQPCLLLTLLNQCYWL